MSEALRDSARACSYGVEAIDHAVEEGVLDRLGRVVALTVLAQSDEPFFDGLTRFFSSTFDAEMVILGKREGDSIRTMAVFHAGSRIANFEYDLPGTPCSKVVGPEMICCYPEDVAAEFPDDAILSDLGIQGYCGAPLFDRSGRMIGLLAILTKNPIVEPEALMALTCLYAGRAAIELEYLMLQEAGEDPEGAHELMAARDAEAAQAMARLRQV